MAEAGPGSCCLQS